MLRTRRLTISIFILGCLFIFISWVCVDTRWQGLRQVMIQLPVLRLLRGKSDSVAQLLFNNAIGAYSVSFGFMIEYFNQKKEIKDKLEEVYLYLRRTCFHNLFCKENAYDFEYDEVANIRAYLSENIYLVKNYRPIVLIVKVRVFNFIALIKEKIFKMQRRESLLSNDLHGMIAMVIADIYRYFGFISMQQMMIQDTEKGIEICLEKLKDPNISQWTKKEYLAYYYQMKKQLEGHEQQLISRFPYNTKTYATFIDKHKLYKIVDAVNTLMSFQGHFSSDFTFRLFPDSFIFEDKNVRYNEDDEEIQLSLNIEEVKRKIEENEIVVL